MNYNIIIIKDEDGYYVAECVELPGCISQGMTIEEATKNIKDAIKGYLESIKKHPEEKDAAEVREMVSVIPVSI